MSSKDGSVAPKERINIKYIPATGDQQSEQELPLRMLVVGDFKGRGEDSSLEDRKTLSIDKTSFRSVMKEADLGLTTSVSNRLEDGADDLNVDLRFASLEDFGPDSIARQVPELRKLVELREALVALKGPLGNVPAFRAKLQELLDSTDAREALLAELDLATGDSD